MTARRRAAHGVGSTPRPALARRLTAIAIVVAAGVVVIGGARTPAAGPVPLATSPLAAPSGLPTPPGTTERVSVGNDGRQGGAGSGGASGLLASTNADQAISSDGRWVAFVSAATNLIPGEAHRPGGLYLRDRQSGATNAIPWVDGRSFPAGVTAAEPAISGDGAVVAFTAIVSDAAAARAVALATSSPYVLAWDRATTLTELVSVDGNARPMPGYQPSISGDGRYVAYTRWFIDTTAPSLSGLTITDPGRSSDGQYYISGPGCPGPKAATIAVTAADPDDAVSSVTLFYQPVGAALLQAEMKPGGSNVWIATIDSQAWDPGRITYWVTAADSHGNVGRLDQASDALLNKASCIL